MAFVRLVHRDDVPPEVREMFDDGEAQYGQVLNTWRAIAHKPEAFAAYLPYLRSVLGPGALDNRVKDLTAVRVCVLNHCRYSTSHRVASSREQGIPDEDLAALVDLENNRDRFDDAELAALDLATEMTLRIPEVSYTDSRQGVDREVLDRIKTYFSDPEISELTLSVSLWNALTRYHRVMDFDLDMPAPPPEIERGL